MERGASHSPSRRARSRSPTPVSSVTGKHAAGRGGDPGVVDDAKKVKITVQKEHTKDVIFIVKRNARLGKLMLTYCLQLGLNEKELKFTYLGKQLKDSETPFDLNMEDEDVIDCFADQIGGRGRRDRQSSIVLG